MMSPSPENLSYAAPRLTVYGNIADLTASGTGTSCESGLSRNGNGLCKGTPNTATEPRTRQGKQ